MPTRLALVAFVTLHAVFANAQFISPSVISTAGGIDQTEKMSLEWTLGEIAVASYQKDGILMTEGFHQPLLQVERLVPSDDNSDSRLDITIAPNPVKYQLSIEIIDQKNRLVELQLIDAQGRLVENVDMDTQVQTLQLDMSDYSSGFYVLRIIDSATNSLLDAYKVAKID